MGFGAGLGFGAAVPPPRFIPSCPFAFQRETHPQKSGVKSKGMAGLGEWEEGRVLGREGCGWAWLGRSGAGGHLPGGSALRAEWGWVL